MARNRKRRSDRRPRHPAEAEQSRQGVATARAQRDELSAQRGDGLSEGVPGPIEHAAPDAELARAELARAASGVDEDDLEDDELEDDEEDEYVEPDAGGGGAAGDGRSRSGGGGELTPAPAGRSLPGNRLVGFLQGSWRELQRVQWPDRRQVMQATGVVIGFVIVAGAFLGAADWVAGKIVHLILP